jgi:hypothetical protein
MGRQTIHLLPGEFSFTVKDASKATGLSSQEIRHQLINMQINKQITIKSTNRYSVISIVNWDNYQGNSTNKSTNITAIKKQTKAKCPTLLSKNIKNIYGEFKNVLLTSEERDKLNEKLGVVRAAEMIETISEGMASNPKRYKYDSHYAAILNWNRRRETSQPAQPASPAVPIMGKKLPTIDEKMKELYN